MYSSFPPNHTNRSPETSLKMTKKPVQYSVIDAFTDSAFKGNPAAVCLLEEERDEGWMQSVAAEFNISETAFLSRIGTGIAESENSDPSPRFSLRWFTPVDEVELCGHATIASAHFLFSSGLVKTNKIEFITKSGLLTVQKVDGLNHVNTPWPSNNKAGEHFSIELNFPTIPVIDCDPTEHPSIPATLNGASMLNIKKTGNGDLIVELLSGEVVAGLQPQFDELQKCAGVGVIITGTAAPGSGYDFFTRYFCPKLGLNEDPVCGSCHCALVPYWSKKLGKNDLIAYMASPRGGKLDLHLEEDTQRVLIRGEAVTVMTGTLLV
ncbi:hypothetical protein MRB53_028161 [Persea americana]|uniref:Uncharacterized protein n=1 Tax=Persea americana TaxID=3435 RepID=A0ACC2KER7_PERAE|nr:hypothetical protein MRB53_028161 [Persea americana]